MPRWLLILKLTILSAFAHRFPRALGFLAPRHSCPQRASEQAVKPVVTSVIALRSYTVLSPADHERASCDIFGHAPDFKYQSQTTPVRPNEQPLGHALTRLHSSIRLMKPLGSLWNGSSTRKYQITQTRTSLSNVLDQLEQSFLYSNPPGLSLGLQITITLPSRP